MPGRSRSFHFTQVAGRPYSLQVSRQEDLNDRTQVQIHDPLVGTTFDGRFHIDFRIAIGGFGAIYHATHKKSGHQFALKILHARLASDPGVIARFQREGETLTRLRNPHTIIAYEMGEADDGTLFIVLELLHGESLFERFRARGVFEWKQMVAIARGVCSSLEEAHELGIIHRDLKPTNINLESKDGDESFAKVLDFGIAKIIRHTGIDNADLTSAGQMIGTLDYMSPEQMVGGACTGQTDIYTLGIVIYEMICGRRPFAEATSPAAVLAAMLRTLPASLSTFVPVPKGLDTIVMKCLAREPEQRWSTVADLRDALDRLLRGEEIEDGTDDVTRTVALPDGEESTVFEERRPLITSPYPAQIVEPSARRLGEAPTEPAPIVGRPSKTHPLNTTLAGRPAPPPRPGERTPTPVITRKPPTGPAPMVPTHGGRGNRPVFADADREDGPPAATPLARSGLALFPPQQPQPGQRKPPTGPPPVAGMAPLPPRPTMTPPRPVMDLQSFAQPAPIPTTPMVPPLAPGPGMPGYDMSQSAARDAALRRIVWIVVLVIGAVIGVVAASQL